MKKILGSFLVVFALVCSAFTILSCQTRNLLWCKDGFILTYDRHTGQLEVMWERSVQNVDSISNANVSQ